MRLLKVLTTLFVCISLAACGQQGSNATDNTSSVDSVVVAEELLRERQWDTIYNNLVRYINDEFEAGDASSFVVKYLSISYLSKRDIPGFLEGIDRDEPPMIYVIQDPFGAVSVKIWYNSSWVQDWTWLYEYLCSLDISEFVDENGVPIMNELTYVFLESQSFRDFCSANLDKKFFEDVHGYAFPTPSGPEYTSGEEIWRRTCQEYGEQFVDIRLFVEGGYYTGLGSSFQDTLDAINTLLRSGVTAI